VTAYHNEKVRKGFNRLSPAYDFLARLFFGKKLALSQSCFLPELKKCRTALIFGGGTGRILSEMMALQLAEHYVYVDISDRMIAKAKKRTAAVKGKVDFICGSYETIPSLSFNLVVTPYVLDCFKEQELNAAMHALAARTAPGAEWLFVDFHVPEKGGMKFLSRVSIRTLYFFFNAVCGLGVNRLPDFSTHFSRLGWTVKKERQFLGGMLSAKIYSRL
jgi:tRNA (cmo5U34)-methyltransferase